MFKEILAIFGIRLAKKNKFRVVTCDPRLVMTMQHETNMYKRVSVEDGVDRYERVLG